MRYSVIIMDTESFEIKGRIDAVSQKVHEEGQDKGKPKRYSVMIGPKWYSGFGRCPWDKGDIANFVYVPKGEYNNVLKILDDNSAQYMTSEKKEPPIPEEVIGRIVPPPEFGMIFNKAVDMAIWQFGENSLFFGIGTQETENAVRAFRGLLTNSFRILWEAENSLREEHKIE